VKDSRVNALTVLLHSAALAVRDTKRKVANEVPRIPKKFCRAISVWGGMDANTNNRGDT